MSLHEDARFLRKPFELPNEWLGQVLASQPALADQPWAYCGFAALPSADGLRRPVIDTQARVDNAFRLTPACGFESLPVVVTTGIRSSRFAAVVFWEVLHVLAVGGTWIDVDEREWCGGTPLLARDFLDRDYFRGCLTRTSAHDHGRFVVQTFTKTQATPIAAHIDDEGWTFGILTSANSSRAAEMAHAILALALPRVEVVFCGPRPAGAPDDERVRTVDLEQPEPRGWISRKKNLLADAARYENLCLLHDRFVITPAWAAALRAYGPVYAFLTFPQVYHADLDRRFVQRYADYQVLYQQQGISEALESSIYAGDHVFYPSYDDFYDTAFCCGGIYLAKRSLWNQVRQNESLYHCEWEDISFGLECQQRGMPHRVNPLLTVESLTAHPNALTRIHSMVAPDTPEHGVLHVSPAHASAAVAEPARFKPVFHTTRASYCANILRRLEAATGAPVSFGADDAAVASLAGFWRAIHQHIIETRPRTREQIAAVVHFLSDTIYNWPHCEQQAWVHAFERQLQATPTAGYDHVIGWGTGSLFRGTRAALDVDLSFLVDGNPATWGTVIAGLEVRAPESLRAHDPGRTAVVVFSCFMDDISRAIREIGPYAILSVHDVLAGGRLPPLDGVIGYFEEVERYYPVLFADDPAARLSAA